MYPELFRIFGYPVTTWGLMLLLGFVAAYIMVRARAEKFGIPRDKVIDLVLYSMLAGIVGSRVVFVLLEWNHYSQNLNQIWDVTQGGMTSFGGYIFGFIVLVIWSRVNRVSLLRTLDLSIAPSFLLIAIGRVGCFFNGCCFGAPTNLPWAVSFPDAVGRVHPAQLYDSMLALFTMAVLLLVERSSFAKTPEGPARGKLFALGLILLGVTRYIYELFRAGSSSEVVWKAANMTLAQMTSIAIVVLGVTLLLLVPSRRPEAKE